MAKIFAYYLLQLLLIVGAFCLWIYFLSTSTQCFCSVKSIPVIMEGHFQSDDSNANVEILIRSWGFEDLIKTFQEEGVDLEAFLLLSEKDIEHLIPKIGVRVKFLNKFKNYLLDNNIHHPQFSTSIATEISTKSLSSSNQENNPDLSSTSTTINFDEFNFETSNTIEGNYTVLAANNIVEDNLLPPPTKKAVQWDALIKGSLIFEHGLRNLLKETSEGRCILSQRKITESLRGKLCKIIVDHLLKIFNFQKIPQRAFQEAALEIEKLFEGESSTIYFNPYKPKTTTSPKILCSGKLWAKYINTKKQYNILDSAAEKSTEQLTTPNEKEIISLEFLRNNVSPWEDVVVHWNLSFHSRKNILKKVSISEYLRKFPAIKQPQGFILLIEDFNKLYPEKQDTLYGKWNDFKRRVTELACRQNIFKDDNQSDGAVIYNMPLLFNVTTIRQPKTKCKSTWRPSKLEVRDSFIVHISNPKEVEETIQFRRQNALKYGTTIQPFLIFCGPIDEVNVYVCVEDILYKIESPIKGLDVTFKIFFALEAKYPLECTSIWQFIQNYIYEIYTEYDHVYSGCETFKADLKSVL